MNARTTWFLAVLAVAGCALIFIFERPYREKMQRQPDTRLLPGLKVSAITNLQIRPGDGFTIRVEKTNGVWQITEPIRYPANPAQAETLLQTLAEWHWDAHITSAELRPKFQEEFGLTTPQFSLVIQENDTLHHLLVGHTIWNQVYLQHVGGDGLYIVDAELLKLFPRKADDWRDPRALPLNAFQVNALEVRSGAKSSFRLELNPTNGLWRLAKPLDARANTEKINSLLVQLAQLTTREFVADDATIDFEKFGLPNSTAEAPELELLFLRGTNVVNGLQIGSSPTNQADQVYASRVNQDAVFLLPKESFEPWRAPYADFRERRLLDLPSAAITNMQVQGEDDFTISQSTNGSWRMIQPESFAADVDLVNQDILLVLSRIEVNFESDVVTDFGAFGLTNPVLQYQLTGSFTNLQTGKTEALTEDISFGHTTNNRVFVRRSDVPRVYSIHAQEFDLLPRSSWQLRDRHIGHFDSSNVVSVTIEQLGKTRKILRNGSNDWAVASGSTGNVNPFSLEEAMHRLGELKAVFWIAQNEKDRAKFGIQEADHRITIELNRLGKNEKFSLEFGDYSPFLHPYAAMELEGQRAVFEFPLPLFHEFVRADLSITPPPLPPQK